MEFSFQLNRDNEDEFEYNGLFYTAASIMESIQSKIQPCSCDEVFEDFIKVEKTDVNRHFKENFKKIFGKFLKARFPSLDRYIMSDADERLVDHAPITMWLSLPEKVLIIHLHLQTIRAICDSYMTIISFTSQKFKMGVRDTVASLKRDTDKSIEKLLKKPDERLIPPPLLSIGFLTMNKMVPPNQNEAMHNVENFWIEKNWISLHLLFLYYRLMQTPITSFVYRLQNEAPKLPRVGVVITNDDINSNTFKIPKIKDATLQF